MCPLVCLRLSVLGSASNGHHYSRRWTGHGKVGPDGCPTRPQVATVVGRGGPGSAPLGRGGMNNMKEARFHLFP